MTKIEILFWSVVLAAVIMFTGLIVQIAIDKKITDAVKQTHQINITHTAGEPMTPERVWNYINEIGIQHPRIVYAQFQLETGNGKSFQARNMNNLFGMAIPSRRVFVGTRTPGSQYASYPHWHYSVIDYALWQSRFAWGLTEQEYMNYLSRVYATAPNYTEKLQTLINQQLWESKETK